MGGILPLKRPLLAASRKRAAICRYRVESANDSLDVAEMRRSTHIKRVFRLEPVQVRRIWARRNRCFLNRGTETIARYKPELLSDHLVCIRDLIKPRDFRENNGDDDEQVAIQQMGIVNILSSSLGQDLAVLRRIDT